MSQQVRNASFARASSRWANDCSAALQRRLRVFRAVSNAISIIQKPAQRVMHTSRDSDHSAIILSEVGIISGSCLVRTGSRLGCGRHESLMLALTMSLEAACEMSSPCEKSGRNRESYRETFRGPSRPMTSLRGPVHASKVVMTIQLKAPARLL